MAIGEGTIQIEGLPELQAKFKALDDAAKAEVLKLCVEAAALPIQNAAKQNAPKKHGILRDSIHTEVVESDDSHASASIGTDVVYAAIQEFGGTIKPKGHPDLAIPLTDTAAAYHPRDYPSELHVQGNALCDASGQAIYALATQVTIPAHPYLRPAIDEHTDEASEAAGIAFKQAMSKALGEQV